MAARMRGCDRGRGTDSLPNWRIPSHDNTVTPRRWLHFQYRFQWLRFRYRLQWLCPYSAILWRRPRLFYSWVRRLAKASNKYDSGTHSKKRGRLVVTSSSRRRPYFAWLPAFVRCYRLFHSQQRSVVEHTRANNIRTMALASRIGSWSM